MAEIVVHGGDYDHVRGLAGACDGVRIAYHPAPVRRIFAGMQTQRAYEVFEKCWEQGVFVRPVGDALAFSPPLIVEKKHLEQMFGTVAEVPETLS